MYCPICNNDTGRCICIIGKPDVVNQPPHYTTGKTEVFDMMVRLFGKEKVEIYCEINAFKYRMRAGYKDDTLQDIGKALWYEKKMKELNDRTGNDK
jgi:hypothetical protein